MSFVQPRPLCPPPLWPLDPKLVSASAWLGYLSHTQFYFGETFYLPLSQSPATALTCCEEHGDPVTQGWLGIARLAVRTPGTALEAWTIQYSFVCSAPSTVPGTW